MNKKEKNGKLPKWAVLLIIVLSLMVAVLGIMLVSLVAYTEINQENISTALSIKKSEGFYNSKTNTYSITGKITNNNEDDIENIQIDYNLYDKDNNIIGVATTYLEELKTGNTWKFTAEYTGPNAKNITHFDINKLDLDEDTWD